MAAGSAKCTLAARRDLWRPVCRIRSNARCPDGATLARHRVRRAGGLRRRPATGRPRRGGRPGPGKPCPTGRAARRDPRGAHLPGLDGSARHCTNAWAGHASPLRAAGSTACSSPIWASRPAAGDHRPLRAAPAGGVQGRTRRGSGVTGAPAGVPATLDGRTRPKDRRRAGAYFPDCARPCRARRPRTARRAWLRSASRRVGRRRRRAGGRGDRPPGRGTRRARPRPAPARSLPGTP